MSAMNRRFLKRDICLLPAFVDREILLPVIGSGAALSAVQIPAARSPLRPCSEGGDWQPGNPVS